MISTKELKNWVKDRHPQVSIHAYDARYMKFHKYVSPHPYVVLVYKVKDHHLFSITDEELKIAASKANQSGTKNLLKYMADVKWMRRHEKVDKIRTMMNVPYDGEDHIVILPEDANMRQAINECSKETGYYIEYLDWDNKGVLDGFIHHKNMYLLNNEYDTRKSICEKLFERFKTQDFWWTNQSCTSLVRALFRQLCGYDPESSYNVKTRKMVDFYPRALQWCTTDDVPENVVNIDICKSYPSVLLRNTSPIPVYTIHNKIEPFNCKSDLRQCGEFYIDDTTLDNYGAPIRLEAGFYSSNLISYLVDELNMLTTIKYKIVTKKTLKPETFREFIEYVFDNFEEGKAKKLANSYIGKLGRK